MECAKWLEKVIFKILLLQGFLLGFCLLTSRSLGRLLWSIESTSAGHRRKKAVFCGVVLAPQPLIINSGI